MGEEIYILKDYKLSRKNNTILLENKDVKEFIPVTALKVIHIFGEFDCNKKFLELTSHYNIILYIYDYYGNCIGNFYPKKLHGNGDILLKQCESYQNIEKRTQLAKKFLNGTTKTILQNLKYYNRRERDLTEEIEKIEGLYEKLQKQNDIEKIMAIEGNIRQIYYKTFNKIILQDGFEFRQRNRRPPKDPINALISFLNTLVYNEVLSQLYSTGLNPAIGYLHSSNGRKETLHLDIAELFKPALADRIIFSLINKRMIRKEDFEVKSNGVLIKEDAKKKIIEEFHKKLEKGVSGYSSSAKDSYRTLIRKEILKIKKELLENVEYVLIVLKV